MFGMDKKKGRKMTKYQKLLKQRELPDGYYYCRTRTGRIEIVCIIANYMPTELFSEVIAPVPSYEEFKETNNTIDKLHKHIIQFHMDNLKRKYK